MHQCRNQQTHDGTIHLRWKPHNWRNGDQTGSLPTIIHDADVLPHLSDHVVSLSALPHLSSLADDSAAVVPHRRGLVEGEKSPSGEAASFTRFPICFMNQKSLSSSGELFLKALLDFANLFTFFDDHLIVLFFLWQTSASEFRGALCALHRAPRVDEMSVLHGGSVHWPRTSACQRASSVVPSSVTVIRFVMKQLFWPTLCVVRVARTFLLRTL